jgi:hypothetical protein
MRPSVFSGSATIFVGAGLDRNNATLKVFSLDGKMVRDFSNKIRLSRSVVLNPEGLRSGIYLVRLIAGNHQYVTKASFVK